MGVNGQGVSLDSRIEGIRQDQLDRNKAAAIRKRKTGRKSVSLFLDERLVKQVRESYPKGMSISRLVEAFFMTLVEEKKKEK